MAQYCPLGTPSLLNGDFSENVARLKDFSWSVFFSSNPIKAEPSIGRAIVYYVEHHPQEFFLGIFFMLLYTAAYAWICRKFLSCIEIKSSRNVVLASFAFGTAICVSFSGILVIYRRIPQEAFSALTAAYFHVAIAHFFLHKKCCSTLPSAKGYLQFRSNPLRITMIIITILVFFFTPSIVRQGDECPHKFYRAVSEMYFWTTFAYIYMSYNCLHYLIYTQQTEVFYIWQRSGVKNYKHVIGQEKKKEGFGWIKDYYNEPLVVTQQ